MSERPQRVRTLAPRGQTPGLQSHFKWKVLSAAAGITWWSCYFRLYRTTIRAPQVVDFLGHLLRHLSGKWLLIWDGLRPIGRDWSAHLSARSGAGSRSRGCPVMRRNSTLWGTSGGYWKHHELPNFCPRDCGELSHQTRCALRRMRRSPRLMRSFWQHAHWSLCRTQ